MSQIKVRLGESSASFLKKHPNGINLVRQPAGVDFYSVDWEPPSYGTVSVDHGSFSFDIPLVLSLQTSEDQADFKSEGLFNFSIYAAITDKNTILHDQARLQVYALLRRILDLGWQQVIERDEPRLSGRARLNYTLATTNSNGLDASFLPTLEEWMRIPSRTPWSFFAKGVYMDVMFTREPTLVDVTMPGAYMLTFNIRTETEYLRSYAGPENRLHWKSLVHPEIMNAALERAKKEDSLRTKGVAIDETYRDPPVPVLQ